MCLIKPINNQLLKFKEGFVVVSLFFWGGMGTGTQDEDNEIN